MKKNQPLFAQDYEERVEQLQNLAGRERDRPEAHHARAYVNIVANGIVKTVTCGEGKQRRFG